MSMSVHQRHMSVLSAERQREICECNMCQKNCAGKARVQIYEEQRGRGKCVGVAVVHRAKCGQLSCGASNA